MPYVLENLGSPAQDDLWMTFRPGRDPRTGAEVVLGSLSRGGFVVIDPRAKTSVQIPSERGFGCAWAIAQAPNGDVWQADYGTPDPKLCVWDWKSARSRIVAKHPINGVFTIDVAPDGKVYLPAYTTNTMHRYDPVTGKFDDFGKYDEFNPHIRNVYCGGDGIVYVTSISYSTGTCVVALDPATGRKWRVNPPPGVPADSFRLLFKDGSGQVLVGFAKWGRVLWSELVNGEPRPIASESVRITSNSSSLAFSDGGYIEGIDLHDVTYIDPKGETVKFKADYAGSPLRIFSIAPGGGRIWGGTFIPLTLFEFDTATSKPIYHGNPTKSGGEIYSMVFAAGKLFMASYVDAILTRYDPAKPVRRDDSIQANPANLGKMKETGKPLQRPHGYAMDTRGQVYFSALGGYGCNDSGVCRIDPVSENVTRWIFPDTKFDAMVHHAATDQLVVSEVRLGVKGVRFTFLSPHDGSVKWSEVVIDDQGEMHSMLAPKPDEKGDAADVIYGMHAYRATLVAFSVSKKKIVAVMPEMRVGEHCWNALMWGPDGRIWGLTDEQVFAVDRGLKTVETIVDLRPHGKATANRFGLVTGDDGAVYLANGTDLMRIKTK
ncbi:MAG: WD40 repeat domain-containing protein [Planctomycetota bacterium]|nr:WD40 repeat domain-containing protein [Planctomycetota bacterium]